jgi:hypothetical protein
MPKQRAVDDEMELARLRPPVDSFAPSAIGEQDTSGWFRRYRLTGLGALVAGILLVLLGGMWTLSELTEPGRYVEHRSFPSIDPFCESNNSPFGNSTITFPGALPSAAPCIKYTNIDISRNNTFNPLRALSAGHRLHDPDHRSADGQPIVPLAPDRQTVAVDSGSHPRGAG